MCDCQSKIGGVKSKKKKTTTKRKTPVKRKTTTKRKTPVKRKTTTKRKTPVKRKTTTKRKTPVKRKTTVKKKTSVKKRVSKINKPELIRINNITRQNNSSVNRLKELMKVILGETHRENSNIVRLKQTQLQNTIPHLKIIKMIKNSHNNSNNKKQPILHTHLHKSVYNSNGRKKKY